MEIVAFLSGVELLDYAMEHKLHIAFLDIEMDGMDGMETARHLKRQNPSMPILFITGKDGYQGQAYKTDVDALGYLEKPLQEEALKQKLRQALDLLNAQQVRMQKKMLIFLEDREEKHIPQHDIVWIEKHNEQSRIVLASGKEHYSYFTIVNLMEELNDYFWQVSQSKIVNSRYVIDVIGNKVFLKHGHCIQISTRRCKEIKAKYKSLKLHR
ncbi:DNA-binding response regulator [Clostridia bacterium]|nr:DNA-binding response regulator [Clostridia bacterium]